MTEKKHNLNVKVKEDLWNQARIEAIKQELKTVPEIIEAALELLIAEGYK